MSKLDLMRKPGYVNPELEQLLAESPVPPVSLSQTKDIYALRENLRQKKLAATAAAGPIDASIKELDHKIPTRDGSEITVRIYKGPLSKGGPVMVMFHGGGFILGGLENEESLCRQWCKKFNGISINVGYRLAPEFVFPTAPLDAYDSVKWTAANSAIHGGDLSKGFILAGISAGANLACTVSHLARDDGMTPKISGLSLGIPSLLSPQAVPDKWKSEYRSREENRDALILNQDSITYFRQLYKDDPISPLMSPVIFPSHQDLPPTYFQVAGSDPLRDEALIYEKILREEANVPTKLDVYPGLPHGFWSWWPAAEFSKEQWQDTLKGWKWLLEGGY